MDEKLISPLIAQAMQKSPANHVTIRRMNLNDIDRVHHIDQLSFTMPWPISSYRYELNENLAALLHVAETTSENGTEIVVGMIVAWLIIDETHIATIAVHPNYRRQGIGKKLLVASLEEAIGRGARLATLEVREGNQAAIQLYNQFGFVVEGRRPRYYHDTHEDAIIMTVTGLDNDYLSKIPSHTSIQGPENGGNK